MKVEIEIPDLAEYYFGDDEDEYITNNGIRDKFIAEAIENFVDKIYNEDGYGYANFINDRIKEVVKENKQNIIDRVVNGVTEQILKNKAIVEQMPKKSEINNISKEWENYFVELIDKAIAKRFK